MNRIGSRVEEAALTDLERLAALEDIKTLKARRIFALDTKDWETYASLHAEDHVSDSGPGGTVRGNKALAASLAANYATITTHHHVHTPIITFMSADEASGIWSLEDMQFWKEDGRPHYQHGFGFYHERYARRNGQWLFTYRRLDRTHVIISPGSRRAERALDRSGELSAKK